MRPPMAPLALGSTDTSASAPAAGGVSTPRADIHVGVDACRQIGLEMELGSRHQPRPIDGDGPRLARARRRSYSPSNWL
ncbi:hypothetical protein [Hyphomicrobium sp. CS1GBMeth3]|uniref:hypothetical protein n=1 Tax=Hyphomicrobium sp. CS1GBMeth3 TaxID=1892845 RepID=UPI0009319FB6|nr:hypothetical protein [Hyphomicrobium sp. CS1GBMeth3]